MRQKSIENCVFNAFLNISRGALPNCALLKITHFNLNSSSNCKAYPLAVTLKRTFKKTLDIFKNMVYNKLRMAKNKKQKTGENYGKQSAQFP